MFRSMIRTRFPAGRFLSVAQAISVLVLLASGQPASGQTSDAFLDPTAGILFRKAQGSWRAVDSSVVRYTSVIKQRIAAGIRTPLKDRTIYHNETAVRAFWDRDHEAIIQVMGARSHYPGR